MSLSPQTISQIADFDSLAGFLRDDLDWPLSLDADLEDLSSELDENDLGLKSGDLELLADSSLRRLRPFVEAQKFGLFFLQFGQNRVSVGTLRRILRALVKKSAARRQFTSENLLFVCATEGFARFDFVRFAGRESGAPRLEAFGWNRGDTFVRTLCTHNLKALKWHDKFESNAEFWEESWAQAFDVESVTQEFFRQYREVFAAVESQIVGIAGAEERRLFTQRLFNRLMFLYFLQKKGWLSFEGDSNYLRALFEAVQTGENFYASRLDAAFFNGLNHFSGLPQDSPELRALRGDVPFLNGGLFEREGPFEESGAVQIPNAAFERILALFESFNFTVEESTPLDVQVAVDPEMLGKVFEELVTGRHETGSYYTPRGVVAFMCREALKGYLVPLETSDAIARFVDDDDASHLLHPEAVLDALRRVKVCDPACGSGAYLLGMMKELLRLRASLFVAHQIDADSEYDKKLEIIGSNLYGVDADRFAANIAMLRLWLSLVIEYDGPNPPPLPNLGYKIGVGDSLLAPNPNAFNLHAQEYARLCPQLETLHHEMFALGINRRKGKKVRQKSEIEADIAALGLEIRKNFGDTAPAGSFDWRSDFAEVFAPRDEATTIFGTLNVGGGQLAAPPEPGGFDLVLANPPYVRQELIKELKPALKLVYGEVYTGVADLYVYFYARALQLLRPGGMLSFISSNKWFRAGYGAKLREHIAATTQVLSITDFGELPVFKTAATFPMIFIAHKNSGDASGPKVEITRWTPVKSLALPYPDVLQLVNTTGQLLPSQALNGSEWTLADAQTAKRLETMRANGTPLGEYVKGQIFYGVKTGFNEAFILDGAKRAELIAQDARSAELIKPMAKGDDIRRWRIEDKGRFLIVTKIGVKMENYPAIMAHLKQWETQLKARTDQGHHW